MVRVCDVKQKQPTKTVRFLRRRVSEFDAYWISVAVAGGGAHGVVVVDGIDDSMAFLCSGEKNKNNKRIVFHINLLRIYRASRGRRKSPSDKRHRRVSRLRPEKL